MRSKMNEIVVSTLPPSTTNMTGFFASTAGFSFFSESTIAGLISAGFQMDELAMVPSLEEMPVQHLEMFSDRAQAERREERQSPDHHDDADQKDDKERAIDRERALSARMNPLASQRARDGQHRHHHEKAPEEHLERQGQVPEGRVRVEPGKGAAVVRGSRGVSVKDLREAMMG